jgi:hypothetical protein
MIGIAGHLYGAAVAHGDQQCASVGAIVRAGAAHDPLAGGRRVAAR